MRRSEGSERCFSELRLGTNERLVGSSCPSHCSPMGRSSLNIGYLFGGLQ